MHHPIQCLGSTWSLRKINDSSSDSNTQDPSEEDLQPDLSTIYESEEENWSSGTELTGKLSGIIMGKKPGRPRKHPKINHFFDYCCKTKRQKRRHKANKQQKIYQKKLSQNLLYKTQQSIIEDSAKTREPKQLAKEILEASQSMGIFVNTNKDKALQFIEDKL